MTELAMKSLEIPKQWDRSGLPAWCYRSQALFELERDNVFLNHWQVAGHVNDVPAPGDWLSFDIFDERGLVMRGQDGQVRAFHNLCRHRGARVVDGAQGQCRGAVVCPFHGWVYNLDGSLRGAAQPTTLGPLDKSQFGLKPIELEIFHGFLFLRFRPGPQPSVAELLQPYDADFSSYRADQVLPVGRARWHSELPVNWKSVRDVDNEGYHVALAHPALQELYGRDYRDIYLRDDLHVSIGFFGDRPGRRWSVKNYIKQTPDQPHLPDHLRKSWSYYGMFPNTVFAFTPEAVQYYQDLPMAPGRTKQSGRQYRFAHESRQQRLARYLASRIDRDTSAEDQQLTIWSNESMRSQAFDGFHLSDMEYGLRRHHDMLRGLLPVMRERQSPDEAEVFKLNNQLIGPAKETLGRN